LQGRVKDISSPQDNDKSKDKISCSNSNTR
jgi:hypothetical protein